jgi:hypothetical protein
VTVLHGMGVISEVCTMLLGITEKKISVAGDFLSYMELCKIFVVDYVFVLFWIRKKLFWGLFHHRRAGFGWDGSTPPPPTSYRVGPRLF